MSDEKKKTEETGDQSDKELADLLDSALADFGKNETSTPEAKKSSNNEVSNIPASNSEAEWSEEFIKEAAQQFETNMASFLDSSGSNITGDQLQQSFFKIAEAASKVIENPGGDTEESAVFAETISQTLQSLNQDTESLQNPLSEAEIMNLFTGSNEEENAFLPFMQGMMQSLLSKEVLYPSLKEILDKYPDWLEQNESNLKAEDIEKYKKQQEIMQQVCAQLEKEPEMVSSGQKKEHFEIVLASMQKLQDYGQPPTELVGPGFQQFDPNAQLDPNQCSLM